MVSKLSLRQRAALVVIFILFIIFLLLVLFSNKRPTSLEFYETPISASLGTLKFNPSQNSLIFSNGRTIASFSLDSKSSKALSNDSSRIPTVDNIIFSDDLKNIVVQFDNVTGYSNLELQMSSEGLDATVPSWWIIKDGDFVFLNQDAQQLSFFNNQLYSLDGGGFHKYSFDSQKFEKLHNIETKNGQFYVVGDSVFFVNQKGELIKKSIVGGSDTVIESNIASVQFSNQGCYISTSLLGQDKSSQKISRSGCKKDKHNFAEIHEAKIDFTNNYLYIVEDQVISQYSLSDFHKEEFVSDKNDGSISKIFAASDNLLIGKTDSGGNYFLDKQLGFKKTDGFSYELGETKIIGSRSNNGFTVIAPPGESLSITQKIAVIDSLRERGFDPNVYLVLFPLE